MQFTIGQSVTLKGVSQKGKNRVREHGPVWTVVDISQTVRFSDVPGPWLLLSSPDTCIRWFNPRQDKDFAFAG